MYKGKTKYSSQDNGLVVPRLKYTFISTFIPFYLHFSE